MPTFSWAVNAGTFLRNEQMHFSQFKHFSGSASPLLFSDMTSGLFLLNDYASSTNEWFVRAGATYSSPWLLLKNLPFFSNRVWNENLHFNYLHTPEHPHYIETGDRKSTRLNSSHLRISYAVFCLKKKKK